MDPVAPRRILPSSHADSSPDGHHRDDPSGIVEWMDDAVRLLGTSARACRS
jgi:hypothetical protein